MRSWGFTFILFGVGSFVLNMMGMEFMLLAWIDTWGPLVGNAIRIGMAVVGGIMMFLGGASEE